MNKSQYSSKYQELYKKFNDDIDALKLERIGSSKFKFFDKVIAIDHKNVEHKGQLKYIDVDEDGTLLYYITDEKGNPIVYDRITMFYKEEYLKKL